MPEVFDWDRDRWFALSALVLFSGVIFAYAGRDIVRFFRNLKD